ncbi:HTH-type transcriptional regulator LeuO [Cedecea lapagei]|uniref:HTH-type transcriptional regulator LeuO n=1 Tax=Cedecea lapagei TaxID=158823 RepID=A0A3S4KWF3_9ENTR|nr:transcriptional regulator LeuO [Cedecea lapagei]VEC00840.1 HTH-type transcriptional regulator LeuO [Cedecea lapagei]
MDDRINEHPSELNKIKPRLRDVDLNLLTVFDMVMKARSITGAARLLGMSQPAVSNAVSRLKVTFNDELFVRYGRGIQPTTRAVQLCSVVRHALQIVQNELPGSGFDPLVSERQFALCIASPLDSKIMPGILDGIKYAAPHVQLTFQSPFNAGIEQQMRQQEVDFLISYEEIARQEFKRVPLFEDEMVLVTGCDHPGFHSPLTVADFYNQQHAVVSLECYCSFSSPWYDTREKQKSIAYQGMAITCVLNVISQTRMVAVAPRWLAESVSNSLKLNLYSLPFVKKRRTCFLSWHGAAGQDKGHLWMQGLIANSCRK